MTLSAEPAVAPWVRPGDDPIARFPVGGPVVVEGLSALMCPVSLVDLQYHAEWGEWPDGRVILADWGASYSPGDMRPFVVRPDDYLPPARQGPQADWTAEDAWKVKRAFWQEKTPMRELARAVGVTVPTVWRLVHGLTFWWAYPINPEAL